MWNNEVMKISTSEMYDISEKYIDAMCGFERANKMSEKIRNKAFKVRDKIFLDTDMEFLLSELDVCVINNEKNSISIGGKELNCNVLGRIKKENIQKIYLFMMHTAMPDLSSLPVSSMYLADTWQTAFADAGRDYLKDYLLEVASKEYSDTIYITETMGPGFYGMSGQSVESFFNQMDADKINIELMPSGMMNPVKSLVGFFLVLDSETALPSKDCASCVGSKSSCMFCKNFVN